MKSNFCLYLITVQLFLSIATMCSEKELSVLMADQEEVAPAYFWDDETSSSLSLVNNARGITSCSDKKFVFLDRWGQMPQKLKAGFEFAQVDGALVNGELKPIREKIELEEDDSKPGGPVHLILKNGKCLIRGNDGKPSSEYLKFVYAVLGVHRRIDYQSFERLYYNSLKKGNLSRKISSFLRPVSLMTTFLQCTPKASLRYDNASEQDGPPFGHCLTTCDERGFITQSCDSGEIKIIPFEGGQFNNQQYQLALKLIKKQQAIFQKWIAEGELLTREERQKLLIREERGEQISIEERLGFDYNAARATRQLDFGEPSCGSRYNALSYLTQASCSNDWQVRKNLELAARLSRHNDVIYEEKQARQKIVAQIALVVIPIDIAVYQQKREEMSRNNEPTDTIDEFIRKQRDFLKRAFQILAEEELARSGLFNAAGRTLSVRGIGGSLVE